MKKLCLTAWDFVVYKDYKSDLEFIFIANTINFRIKDFSCSLTCHHVKIHYYDSTEAIPGLFVTSMINCRTQDFICSLTYHHVSTHYYISTDTNSGLLSYYVLHKSLIINSFISHLLLYKFIKDDIHILALCLNDCFSRFLFCFRTVSTVYI